MNWVKCFYVSDEEENKSAKLVNSRLNEHIEELESLIWAAYRGLGQGMGNSESTFRLTCVPISRNRNSALTFRFRT
ncbi:MAG: hypothetical protein K0S39_5009 [Paenibacillus sp.]|jgi:hypothetical protein|nr:hypothetical protein [Paenibacillus sp.]